MTAALEQQQQATAFFDPEAEQAVLGACLLDPDAVHLAATVVTAADFASVQHQHIFRAAQALGSRSQPIDPLSLRNQLDQAGALTAAGGIAYLAELSLAVPSAASVEHYAGIVADRAERRRINTVCRETAAAVGDLTKTVGDLKTHLDAVTRSATANLHDRPLSVHVRAAWAETEQARERAAQGQAVATGLPTGFRQLDTVTNGLLPGQLWVLGARSRVGKTTFATQVARSVAPQTPVLFACLEMTETQLAHRLIAAEVGRGYNADDFDYWRVSAGRADAQDYERMARAVGGIETLPIHLVSQIEPTMSTIRQQAKRQQVRDGLGLVVIDYLGRVRARTREGTTAQASEIVHDAKNLAMEMQVPVLLLAQLNREVDKRTGAAQLPQLSDLRDSGEVEATADVVLLLHRASLYDEKANPPREALLLIAKQRQGPEGKVRLTFMGEHFAFREAAR